ncbi:MULTISPECIES: YihY/virulence factor BrkB family protein [unclassified Roseivivax]|uniref:YihY/virulence factor BrkB family protein n=1 Tax=unclassified Roseivivax TaxID=2639302 RepID=UPI001268403C|nr:MULTISPECIES: YihY/virulence factor BrkB family protein [unclassified Roseivivax]QFT48856.1 hypothetical protein FIU97_19870 [Roseivivax sp. THAF40]QFT65041.1 hypothetical protein FIU91_19035 [Roseivivax sp. THAF30]
MTNSDYRLGRRARRPREIPPLGWRDIALRLYRKIGDDHVVVVSAGVAFFGLLAIFPALTALISIAGIILEPNDVYGYLDEISNILPPEAAGIIRDQAQQVASQEDFGVGIAAIFGLLLALYGASRGLKTLIEGMNIAYAETEARNIFWLSIVAFCLTALLVVGAVTAIVFTIVVPGVLDHLGLSSFTVALVTFGRWPILAIFTVSGLAVVYRYGPSRRNPKWRWVYPGACLATVLWIISSIIFSIYVRNFGGYNETYGALGGAIILLTWLWVSSFIILLGAELNAEMEHQTREDTTVGRDRSEGKRGAIKADTVGENVASKLEHSETKE